MSNLTDILGLLSGVKKTDDGKYQACCPVHSDNHASLSLSETPEGKLLLYCHAGCTFEQVIKSLDFVKNSLTPIIANIYDYTDRDNKLLYQVVRYYPKAFRQRRPDGNGGWIWNLKEQPHVIYHLPDIIGAIQDKKQVFIVEGEKDVETLNAYGLTATSISGGAASKWSDNLVAMLEGGNFIIIPDADAPGEKYADYVAKRLFPLANIKIIKLSVGKDVSDYLETESIQNLLNIVENTLSFIPEGLVRYEDLNDLIGLCMYLLRENKRLSYDNRKRYTKYSE